MAAIKWKVIRLTPEVYWKLRAERCENETFSQAVDRLVQLQAKVQQVGLEMSKV